MLPARLRPLVARLVPLVLAACASVPPPTTKDPLRVEKAPPEAGARPLGTLRAVDGKGCGLFGTMGTYEGATANLRAQARALGADYVQITDVTEPHAERECVNKEYVLVGIAYRTPAANAPSATLPVAASAASASVARGPAAPAPVASSSTCTATRTLEFSVRDGGNGALGVWIDQVANAAPSGLELRYVPGSRELELVRFPEAKTLAVTDDPIDLGSEWHDFRLERSPAELAVKLDGKLLLFYATPAPRTDASFALDAAGFELRGMRLGCANASH